MSDKSAIEWTDASWNPIRARRSGIGADGQPWERVGWHCEHATTACEFCYAEKMNKWRGTGLPFKPGHRKDVQIFLDPIMLELPLRWKKPRRIFVCSMTDLFADFVKDEWIEKMLAVMALCPQHTFQVLTKRADRMWRYTIGQDPLPNVWLGVSVERQEEADERIPLLLRTPAAVRFISAEPLLGPIDLGGVRGGTLDALLGHDFEDIGDIRDWGDLSKNNHPPPLNWVIVGGESGPSARPMSPVWARSIRDQCQTAGVPLFFKQWGGRNKKAAGRLLDGRTWDEYPRAAV